MFKALVAGLFLASLIPAGCGSRDASVEFYFAQGHHFSQAERGRIEQVVADTARDVRALLPTLPHGVRLLVRAGHDVIPETGETGNAIPPATVIWTVDPDHDGGVLGVVNSELRASLFHEFHHLVRNTAVPPNSLLDEVISEGMASVFEDHAGPRRPWASYGPEVKEWLGEIRSQPPGTKRNTWFGLRPDGRRWVGHRVGSYLADEAAHRSGLSDASLAVAPTERVLQLAGVEP